ncbi:hypothetical protein [Streptomyces sp. NPDC021224]|uniref:hypothetical protein n=1 Tax=unclassified Streptomyces TaxID=2593676 RepID=UPI003797F69E
MAATVVSSAGTASAGTNGQQLRFYDSEHMVYSVYVVGPDQNGNTVSHCFSTPTTDNHFTGWWWKGQVRLYIYTDVYNWNCNNMQEGMVGVNVPAYQSGSDWYTVYDVGWWD